MAKVQLIDQQLFETVLAGAQQSDRLRKNYNFHPSLSDNPHRFLNVMLKGTYITPHRHANPPKAEAFLILKGEVAFVTFKKNGEIDQIYFLHGFEKEGTHGIDIAPGVWHTLIVLSEQAICYEVKPGPYEVTTDKEFADWAPHEGSGGCQQYLQSLTEKIEAAG